MPELQLSEGQPHQFTGLRGMTEVTVRVRDIYNAALVAADLLDVTCEMDHVVLAQQVCCEVEAMLGIYRTVPSPTPEA